MINIIDSKRKEISRDSMKMRWESDHLENREIGAGGTREFLDFILISEGKDKIHVIGKGFRLLDLGGLDYFVNLSVHSQNQIQKHLVKIHNGKSQNDLKLSDVTDKKLNLNN